VAPTLQVLLSRMYAEFPEDPLIARPFSLELYRRLKANGLLLRDFLDLGLKALSALGQAEQDAVRSGLVLEVLEEYTTEWGTAKALRQEELKDRFPEKQSTEASRLADRLEGLYLLTRPEEGVGQLALAHDTLATVVRHAHQVSIAPAQRARHLLENKLPEWKERADGTVVLDGAQLGAVEEGLSAMRRMHPDEERLVDASREQEKRRREEESERKRRVEEAEKAAREAKEGRLRFFRQAAVTLAGAFALSMIAAGVAGVQWRSAHKSAESEAKQRARADEKTKLAEQNEEKAKQEARISQLRLEHSALVQAQGSARTDPLRGQAILDDEKTFPVSDRDFAWGYHQGLVGWVRSFAAHAGFVRSVAFSVDGKTLATGGDDGKLRLWEATTGQPRGEPNKGVKQGRE
jgi:WD domain, G-beta repeat